MKPRDPGRTQALKVAGSATALGIIVFVIIVLVFNAVLIGHLTSQVDTRLVQRLDITTHVLSEPGASDAEGLETTSEEQDNDDAPIFIWTTDAQGKSALIGSTGPRLPNFPRTTGLHSATIGRSTYRFDVGKFKKGYLIIGESFSNIIRIEKTLYLTELIVALVLIFLMFLAAYIVGIRALAPVSLARTRQTAFIADASHELRTPLSVLEAEIQVALGRNRDAQSYRSTLERIGKEGDRLQQIVEELLWLVRSDSDPRHTEEMQRVEFLEIVRDACARFGVLAKSRDAVLTFHDLVGSPVYIVANEELLAKLLGILLDNACKFAGPHGTIEVSLSRSAHRVTLRVEDSGPGVAPHERDQIFERFHHSLSPLGGTGLGLAIADSIVQTTRASRTVGTSHLGGARFEIVWPDAP